MFEPNHIQKDVFKFLTHSEYVSQITFDDLPIVEEEQDTQSKKDGNFFQQHLKQEQNKN